MPKLQETSVARNRLKRRLRELVRLRLLPGAPSVDVVIRARREAYGASFQQLANDVERALARLTDGGRQAAENGTASAPGA